MGEKRAGVLSPSLGTLPARAQEAPRDTLVPE